MKWEQLQQESIEQIIAWAETQSWCAAMQQCAQDAQWHSEGDVWTHTKMVCRQLPLLDQWPALSRDQQLILIMTALFHDAAKPLTTRVDPESGRVSSPKHAVKGEQLVRGVLRTLGCDLATREQIARMVRFHGRPAFLAERSHPAHEVVRLSWLVCNELLYHFAVADTRGRSTSSMDRPEENLQYWKLLSQEQQCYRQPFAFANDHARFLFCRHPEPDLTYVPYESYSCCVTMMSGLPGSGKDAWLARYREDLPVVSLDQIRRELGVDPTDNQGAVAQLARERCREFLRKKTSFAFNATNILRMTRARWIDLFADYHAQIEMVYVEPPLSMILQQNKNRTADVPERVIGELAAKIEPPTWTECHQLIMHDGKQSQAAVV